MGRFHSQLDVQLPTFTLATNRLGITLAPMAHPALISHRHRIRALPFVCWAVLGCGVAVGQPQSTHLGVLASPGVTVRTAQVVPFTVTWWSFDLPPVSRGRGEWLDIVATGGTITGGDSLLALFGPSGQLIAIDSNDGPGLHAAITLGLVSPARSVTGVILNGRDGAELAGGRYWLAILGDGVRSVFSAPWVVEQQHSRAGSVEIRFDLGTAPRPTPPGGQVRLDPVAAGPGVGVFVYVTAQGGTNPPSTGLRATLAPSALNTVEVPLRDDGFDADAVANDGTFSARLPVPMGVSVGPTPLAVTMTDAQGRSGQVAAELFVLPEPPVNDDCGNARAVGEGEHLVQTLGASESGDPVCGESGRADVWLAYTPSAAGTAVLATCGGATFAAGLSIFDQCGSPAVGCGAASCGAGSIGTQLVQAADPRRSMLVRVASASSDPRTGGLVRVRITLSPTVVCRLDFNVDEAVNVDDLSDFIGEFFSVPPNPGPGGFADPSACVGAEEPAATFGLRADHNADCAVNTDDLTDFVTAYFVGC